MSVDLNNPAKQTFKAKLKTQKDGLSQDTIYDIVIQKKDPTYSKRQINIMKITPFEYYYELDGTKFNEDFADISEVVIDNNGKGGGGKARRLTRKSSRGRKTRNNRRKSNNRRR
jgi:hypothetical protein